METKVNKWEQMINKQVLRILSKISEITVKQLVIDISDTNILNSLTNSRKSYGGRYFVLDN